MPKYRVWFLSVASVGIEVEAEDREAAIDEAYDSGEFPRFDPWAKGDLGQWELASDLLPDSNKPEDDVEEIEE